MEPREITRTEQAAQATALSLLEANIVFDRLAFAADIEPREFLANEGLPADILASLAVRAIERLPERPRKEAEEIKQALLDAIKELKIKLEEDNSRLVHAAFYVAEKLDGISLIKTSGIELPDDFEHLVGNPPIDNKVKEPEERVRISLLGLHHKLDRLLISAFSGEKVHQATLSALSGKLTGLPNSEEEPLTHRVATALTALIAAKSLEALTMGIALLDGLEIWRGKRDNPSTSPFSEAVSREKAERYFQYLSFPIEFHSRHPISQERREELPKILLECLSTKGPATTDMVKDFLFRGLRIHSPASPLGQSLLGLLSDKRAVERHGENIINLLRELEGRAPIGKDEWRSARSTAILSLISRGELSPALAETLIRKGDREYEQDILKAGSQSYREKALRSELQPSEVESALLFAAHARDRDSTSQDLKIIVGALNLTAPEVASAFRNQAPNLTLRQTHSEAILLGLRRAVERQMEECDKRGEEPTWSVPIQLANLFGGAVNHNDQAALSRMEEIIASFPPITTCKRADKPGEYVTPLSRQTSNAIGGLDSVALHCKSKALAEYALREIDGAMDAVALEAKLRMSGRKGRPLFNPLLQLAPEAATKTLVDALLPDPVFLRADLNSWADKAEKKGARDYIKRPELDIKSYLGYHVPAQEALLHGLAVLANWNKDVVLNTLKEGFQRCPDPKAHFTAIRVLYKVWALTRDEYKEAIKEIPGHRSHHFRAGAADFFASFRS